MLSIRDCDGLCVIVIVRKPYNQDLEPRNVCEF